MAIQMKEEIVEQGPISKEIGALIDFAEIQGKIQAEISVSVGEATQKAIDRMDRMTTDVMNRVKSELVGLTQQKTRIMAVEVDGQRRKLTQPANKHLGRMIVNAKLGLNTLLVGPAGSGKSIAAGQVAEAMGLAFSQLCFTAGASETWLFGRQTPNGFIEGGFAQRYRTGGVFLGDELDAADSNTLLSINTAIAGDTLYNPISGELIKRHPDFVFIGAANTVGKGADATYTGRSRLDGSTLNRFIIIMVDYCSDIEMQACPDQALRETLQNARKKLNSLRATEIISTRTLAQAFTQAQAGISKADIFSSITAGWPSELIEQCGLDAKAEQDAIAAELEKARKENAKLKGKGKDKADPFQF